MAEATVPAAQVRKRRDSEFPGYDAWLDDRARDVFSGCLKRGTKIVTNRGCINHDGAAEHIVRCLREFDAMGIMVASINSELISNLVQCFTI